MRTSTLSNIKRLLLLLILDTLQINFRIPFFDEYILREYHKVLRLKDKKIMPHAKPIKGANLIFVLGLHFMSED